MNFEPLIRGIADIVGAVGKVAVEGAPREKPSYSPIDVERWLGPLSAPEKQVPVIHDYLRGTAALAEGEATGTTHVRNISLSVWQSAQHRLQAQIDSDPEMQQALKNIYVGRQTSKSPDVTTVEEPAVATRPEPVSIEVPKDTPTVPQARPKKPTIALSEVQRRQQSDAWHEFAIAVESQDEARVMKVLEDIRALHSEVSPMNVSGTTVGAPSWQRAIDYMAGLEQQVQEMTATKIPNEDWSRAIETWRTSQGIDQVELPKAARDAVRRFEAWADAQKPPSTMDRVGEVLGVPRAVMSSADLSAPGRQGLLMISRREYWENLRPMVEAWNPERFAESQRYIQNHADIETAREAGLALTDIHSKLTPREEAFQSHLAERIPVMGNIVRSSEQAYITFLNRLRIDMFSNSLREAAAAGVDVADQKFLKDLAEWINTSTGRGGRNLNIGVLGSVLFSPRLAVSRLQTFNPQYYWKLHPFVRAQALKANLAAAAFVYGFASVASLGGAKVVWDFRNPDAGKVRIGNTRIDLGGGHLQFLRLFTQVATGQKVNPDTGEVTELGAKFGAPSRRDVALTFLMSKEAPVPSLVTDWLHGKDMSGKKFDLTDAVISRMVPLAVQDMYDVLKDQGVQGLFYAAPAVVGVGIQTYPPRAKAQLIPFIGVQGEVPPEMAADFAKTMEEADSIATAKALARSRGMSLPAARTILRSYVQSERLAARINWIRANKEAYVAARKAGVKKITLEAPRGRSDEQ